MGRGPACLIPLVLVSLFQCLGLVFGLNALQVGRPEAGIDIRIPLNAFQCDRYLVYHKVAPNDYGRSLGINYDDVALHFTTPDDARRVFLRLGIPSSGEGVISWQVNLRQGTRFWVAPHGPIQQGEVVGVELGGAGADCLGIGTRTASEPFVTYDGNAYQSVQNQLNAVSTRFPNQMTTSPEAGLPTRLAAAGVIVAPQASVPTPSPSSPSNTSQNPDSDPTSDPASTSGQEPTHSQSGQSSESSGSTNVSSTNKPGSDTPNSSDTSKPPNAGKDGSELPGSTNQDKPSQPSQTDTNGSGSDPSDPAPRKLNLVPIIVGVVAGVLLIVAAIACWIILRRRRQHPGSAQIAPYTMIESGIATPGSISSTQLASSGTPGQAGKLPLPPQNRFFSDSSYAPSEPSTVSDSPPLPMDLVRALAVVAAHVRSGEDVHADPAASAPPEYSRAAAATPTATWSEHHGYESSAERTVAGSSSALHKR